MRLFGLIGNPLSHSRSQEYFRARFRNDSLTGCDYQLFPIHEIRDLPALLNQNPDLEGINVTIPYKEAILPLLDEISKEAGEIGAVNVVTVSNVGGKRILKGYNTDAQGFKDSLPQPMPYNKSIILGSGGAEKSINHVLKNNGFDVVIVSRNPDHVHAISYEELKRNFKILANNSLIINTTPLGMYPVTDDCPPLPYELLNESMFLYDLIYNPPMTKFLKQASSRGLPFQNGEQMFNRQADLSYSLFMSGTC